MVPAPEQLFEHSGLHLEELVLIVANNNDEELAVLVLGTHSFHMGPSGVENSVVPPGLESSFSLTQR